MALGPRQIVATICPELSSSPSLDDYLVMAVELTDRGFFGKVAPYAIAYRACHLFAITGDGNSGDPSVGTQQIASIKEGDISTTFATNAKSESKSDVGGLDTTKYGKMLLGLIKSRPTLGVNTAGLI